MNEDSSSMTRLLEESQTKQLSWFESMTSSPFWNICLLALAWSWTLTTSTLLTTIGPLSAVELGASDSLAAFTIGIFLIGAAVSSVPSAYLFHHYGRFGGFSMGCLAQISGSVLGVVAMEYGNRYCLYLGCFSVGIGQGLGQFYRFSAVETSPAHLKTRAVTYVLSGGVIAAFLGPTSADQTVDFAGKPYVGSFATMAIIGILNELTIMLVNFPKKDVFESKTSAADAAAVIAAKRTVWQIISQPLFIVSCAVATLAHTIMVMLMSNVTLAMKNNDYSLRVCSLVMELHFFAMFAPGFYTGFLIKKYGTFIVALIGGLIFAASIFVLAIRTESWNYFVGMILLGAGWNFSFSSGTVMLTSSYRPSEAPDVQAVNDVILFTVAGGGSLLSGVIFQAGGWLLLIYVVSGLAVVNLGLFVVAWGLRNAADQGELAKVDMETVVQDDDYSESAMGGDRNSDVDEEYGRNKIGLISSSNRQLDSELDSQMNAMVQSAKAASASSSASAMPISTPSARGVSFDSSSSRSHRVNDALRASAGSGTSGRSVSMSEASSTKRSVSFSIKSSELFQPERDDMDENALAIRTMSVS